MWIHKHPNIHLCVKRSWLMVKFPPIAEFHMQSNSMCPLQPTSFNLFFIFLGFSYPHPSFPIWYYLFLIQYLFTVDFLSAKKKKWFEKFQGTFFFFLSAKIYPTLDNRHSMPWQRLTMSKGRIRGHWSGWWGGYGRRKKGCRVPCESSNAASHVLTKCLIIRVYLLKFKFVDINFSTLLRTVG